jgi:thymidylate synthase
MLSIMMNNVHEALPVGLQKITHKALATERESRNGPVLVFNMPVATCYLRPDQRVMFWPERDANPFFHLYESFWMLHGCQDAARVAAFVARMGTFSDDGVTLHGAYGYRWRSWFQHDQLAWAIKRLKANRDDRRVVIGMWDAGEDPKVADAGGKDVPCNTHIYVNVNNRGELDITVCCRSNDMVWGAYGANAVHFSMLQEYLAAAIGVPMGRYYQISNNMHVYKKVLTDELLSIANEGRGLPSPYANVDVAPYALLGDGTPPEQLLEDIGLFIDDGATIGLRSKFMRRVFVPMCMAHEHYRKTQGLDRYNGALEILEQCKASDWRRAGSEWITRRKTKFLRGADDGPVHQA